MRKKYEIISLLFLIFVILLYNIGLKDYIENQIELSSIVYKTIDIDMTTIEYKNMSIIDKERFSMAALSENDPNIIINIPSSSYIKNISFDIEVKEIDNIQLFYLLESKQNYSEPDSVILKLKKGKQHLKVDLPDEIKKEKLKGLRLDPVEKKQDFLISNIKIND